MCKMNLLLVEDNPQDQETCQNAVNDFTEDNGCEISLDIKTNVTDAINSLNSSYYDGAIIDMRLADQGDEGNAVIEQIRNTLRRIPVVIMTGTPDAAETEGFPLVELCKKGDIKYSTIVNNLWEIYNTGLTRILGGRGEIERKLSQIFITNLLPQKESWIAHAAKDAERTEKSLLRHAMNHLVHSLDNDIDKCYPEEVYIHPPIQPRINPGCLIKNKETSTFYIVMNPACDLAERESGGCKTDRALLVEIQNLKDIFPKFNWSSLSKDNKKSIDKLFKNNHAFYYHWLPKTTFYCGGVINFRRVSTHSESDLADHFEKPDLQISPSFLKDIVSRFSSYYARQGQPDIDYEHIQIESDQP